MKVELEAVNQAAKTPEALKVTSAAPTSAKPKPEAAAKPKPKPEALKVTSAAPTSAKPKPEAAAKPKPKPEALKVTLAAKQEAVKVKAVEEAITTYITGKGDKKCTIVCKEKKCEVQDNKCISLRVF
jgi:hypothetical protein